MAIEDAADVTIQTLRLEGEKLSVEVASALTAADMNRTIDGAPTLTLQMHDPNEQMVQAGGFNQKVTAQIDGKGFRAVKIARVGSTCKVVLEDLATAEMRTHITPAKCEPGVMTRLEFARQLLNEDGSSWIEIHVKPGVEMEKTKVALARGVVASSTADTGVDLSLFPGAGSSGATLTAVEVARVALKAGFTGNDLVTAVAVAKAESGWRPAADNTGTNSNGSTDYGLWQINTIHKALFAKYNNNWKDPLTNAKMAFEIFKGSGWRAWSAYNAGKHKPFMAEAQAAVNNTTSLQDPTTGLKLTAAQRRKTDQEKLLGGAEDTWSCIKRIFAEINWRAYVDWDSTKGKWAIYVGHDDLFKDGTAEINVTKDSQGVDNIEYDFDLGKPTATMTLYCRSHRWQLPPGTWINVPTTGLPPNWLVASIDRSFFSTQCTVSLKQFEPALPEPEASVNEDNGILGDLFGDGGDLAASDPTGQTQATGSVFGNGDFTFPLTGISKITDQFGAPRGGGRTHKGIDFGISIGTDVYASRDGVVTTADGASDPGGYGKMVIIKHDFNSSTTYAHLSVIAATRGMQVRRGDLIGKSGQTGNASGPCLHFEIRIGDVPVDPIPFLNNKRFLNQSRYKLEQSVNG